MNKEIVPYILAGYPDILATEELLRYCASIGMEYIELGIPFTDPSADGPVISNAASEAVQQGSIANTLKLLKEIKSDGIDLKITIMSYANPIYKYGIKQFFKDFSEVNLSGLLIPDLPFEEKLFITNKKPKSFNIKMVWMVSENLDDNDLKNIVSAADFYVYLVSYLGTTGKNINNFVAIQKTIQRIKAIKNIPVAVGFGIKSKDDVDKVLKIADGAVIGTRLIELLTESVDTAKYFLDSLV